jgi:hypothetical protein
MLNNSRIARMNQALRWVVEDGVVLWGGVMYNEKRVGHYERSDGFN